MTQSWSSRRQDQHRRWPRLCVRWPSSAWHMLHCDKCSRRQETLHHDIKEHLAPSALHCINTRHNGVQKININFLWDDTNTHYQQSRNENKWKQLLSFKKYSYTFCSVTFEFFGHLVLWQLQSNAFLPLPLPFSDQ